MKKVLSAVLAVLTICAFTLSSSPAMAKAKVKMKFAHSGSLQHQYQIGAEHFKKLVEERSGGDISVTIFPQAQLGGERELAEGVRMGTIECAVMAANGALPNWVPELQVLAVPYIFKTREQVYTVLDGPFGDGLSSMLAKKGFANLAFWEIGFRNFTSNVRAINTPADLKGQKIRVQESKIWMEFIKRLGGIPTPIPFSELYTALQQGVVDGEENPVPTIKSMKFYEVQKYVSLDRHSYEAAVVLANPAWLESLKPEYRDIVVKAAHDAALYQRDVLTKNEESDIAFLRSNGVEVMENPDLQAFAEATEGLNEVISDMVPAELVEQLKKDVAAVK